MISEDMELKEMRLCVGLTQEQAAELLGVSVRSYKDYENKPGKTNTLKYRAMKDYLYNKYKIDEEHGVLTMHDIISITSEVLERYEIEYCYLFGSYAKGYATDRSDVDLLAPTNLEGIEIFGLIEDLREALHKQVDLIEAKRIHQNPELLQEILRDGIKIYRKENSPASS